MESVISMLKDLTALPGLPGREEAVSRFLVEYKGVDAKRREVDASGNTWLYCEGPAGPPVVLCAHMDEVGFRVKRIENDGRLSIIGHERTDLRTLASEVVDVWTSGGVVKGFVYAGQQTGGPKDYANMVPENVFIDLGVTCREDAEKLGVNVGDCITYDARFFRLAGDILCAKAFDDRSGVAAVLKAVELSRGARARRPVVLGTVQEEIGGHGALAVDFPEKPGAIINVDICGGEVYGLPEQDRRGILGKGPIMHDGPEISVGIMRRLMELAREKSIPLQHRSAWGRGADQSILQQKSGGVPTMGIILPMAYYHGPRGFVHPMDVLNAARLISAALCDAEFLQRATKW